MAFSFSETPDSITPVELVISTVSTMLSDSLIYMMAGNGRKPLAIGMNGSDPLELTIDPYQAGDLSVGISLTYNIDQVAIFSDHIGVVAI